MIDHELSQADESAPAAGPARIPARTDAALDRLWDVVERRRGAAADVSYTAALLAQFPTLPARKLAEEATECVIEAVSGERDALVRESADLLYHLVVLLVGAGIPRGRVFGELVARENSALRGPTRKRRARRKASRGLDPGTRKIP